MPETRSNIFGDCIFLNNLWQITIIVRIFESVHFIRFKLRYCELTKLLGI